MATLTGGQGNVTYMWSNGGTTSMISGLIAGTYGVTVMDDILAGCEAIGSVTVSEPPAGCLIAVTATGTNVTSNGGSDGSASSSISGELGNITYAWSNGETTAAIVNITAGVYTVTVTDDTVAGCSASATVTITEPALTCDILANLSVTPATTAGGSDGAAEAVVSGAQGNLTYMWSNGGTTSMITGLPTNTYSVTVTDDVVAGCTASASGLVTDPSVITSSPFLSNSNLSLNVYPVPADDELILEWQQPLTKDGQVIIYNIHGQKIIYKLCPARKKKLEINTKNLVPGLYFCTLVYDDKQISSSFIKK